jgi:alkylation response protein AidB-like acyl-CoA dehydrogenase
MNEEFARAGVPRITRGMGEWLVGPSIIVWGTDEQKAHFLPRIIDGRDRYCQGFSEPDAGSDLASLKTRGVVDGDEVVITGQKVWTSGAQLANMMFCLCRTDPEAPKHRGISYVLTPTGREGGEPNGFELRPVTRSSSGGPSTWLARSAPTATRLFASSWRGRTRTARSCGSRACGCWRT